MFRSSASKCKEVRRAPCKTFFSNLRRSSRRLRSSARSCRWRPSQCLQACGESGVSGAKVGKFGNELPTGFFGCEGWRQDRHERGLTGEKHLVLGYCLNILHHRSPGHRLSRWSATLRQPSVLKPSLPGTFAPQVRVRVGFLVGIYPMSIMLREELQKAPLQFFRFLTNTCDSFAEAY